MKRWSLLKSAARNLLRKQQVESQLDEEVHAYVDLVTQERIAAGLSPSKLAAARLWTSAASSR
jgi:ribosome-binding protein aMBF1 (putative translation factor)